MNQAGMTGLEPLSWQARTLIHDPDRQTRWVVVISATLTRAHPDLDGAVARLHRQVPKIGAHLLGDRWVGGSAPQPQIFEGDLVARSELVAGFDLSAGPPVRILASGDCTEIALSAHHAAFDGLGLLALLSGLLGGPLPQPVGSRPRGPSEGLLPGIMRLARPAQPVAATTGEKTTELLLISRAPLGNRNVTAKLAAASEAAAAAHNLHRGASWRRVGISIGVGGPKGVGYVSSFRRVDVRHGDDVARKVDDALARRVEPFSLVHGGRAMRLLAPLSGRASDSLLVSNLGRHSPPEVDELRFFPVARGRSAVAVGAAGLTGGNSTVTLRTLKLGRADAASLLEGIVLELERQGT